MATGRFGRGHAGLVTLLCVVLLAWPALASKSVTHRAFVYRAPDMLLQRVRGQTGDLDWELVVSSEPPPKNDTVRAAVAKGEAESAELVLWFEAVAEGGWQVYSVDVAREDLLSRRVSLPESGKAIDDSAAAEAAALVVRSILSSMSSGGYIGVVSDASDLSASEAEQPQPPAAIAPEPETSVPRAAPAEDPVEQPSSSDQSRAHALWLQAGWTIAEDSSQTYVAHGPEAGVGFASRRWDFGLRGSYALPRTLTDSLARIRLTRFAVTLRTAYGVWHRGPWSIAGGVEAGVGGYTRTTVARDSDVTATDDSVLVGALLAADVTARMALSRKVPLSLVAALGVEVLPRAPVLQYVAPDETIERARIWPAQPRVSFAFEVRPKIF